MGKLILVTGGARSGKSTFAEEMARGLGKRILYIATSLPVDDEMKDRIKKHREQRPSEWKTVETYKDFECILTSVPANVGSGHSTSEYDGVLLDCLTIMITNLMFDSHSDWDNITSSEMDAVEIGIKQEIGKLISFIEVSTTTFIIVTNETGMGVVPWYPSARAFRDYVGRANQMLAGVADEVYFCVSGIPMKIK